MAQTFPRVTVTHADTPEGELTLHPTRCNTDEDMWRMLAVLMLRANGLTPADDAASEIAEAKPLICRDDKDKLGIVVSSLLTNQDVDAIREEADTLRCHPLNVIQALIVYELWRYLTTSQV